MKTVVLPNKLIIINRTFKVIRSKDIYGSSDFKKRTITITNDKNLEVVLEVLMHEVLEVICEILRYRYDRSDINGNYEFHYDHRGHDQISASLSQVLQQIKIIKK